MIVNGSRLLKAAPIQGMFDSKRKFSGTSHGLAEAGYDIRVNQDVHFYPATWWRSAYIIMDHDSSLSNSGDTTSRYKGSACLASAIEKFQMPQDLVGVVHDKSTWARKFLSVQNTVVEPGWHGYLTLEFNFYGSEEVHIQRGQGIAQVLFSRLEEDGDYGDGKYQNQQNRPVAAKS
jgi:dCTP deaminase